MCLAGPVLGLSGAELVDVALRDAQRVRPGLRAGDVSVVDSSVLRFKGA